LANWETVSGQFGGYLSMAPAQCRRDRSLRTRRIVELIVPAIGICLQDTGEGLKMPGGMLVPAITRGVIQRRRWRATVKGPVVTPRGQDVAGYGFPLGQDGHRRFIAVHRLGSQDMALDQRRRRLQARGAGATLVGQRRPAKIDAFPPVSLALPVQRLMLAEL